jgi:hypothetical protein
VDFAQLPRLFDEAKAVKSLGGRPLAVVTASVGQRRGWGTAQDRLAKLSTKSVHGTVEGATHTALLEDKPFAVITSRAIEQSRATRSFGISLRRSVAGVRTTAASRRP